MADGAHPPGRGGPARSPRWGWYALAAVGWALAAVGAWPWRGVAGGLVVTLIGFGPACQALFLLLGLWARHTRWLGDGRDPVAHTFGWFALLTTPLVVLSALYGLGEVVAWVKDAAP